MINKNQLGLSLGIFFAAIHAIWSLAVLAGIAQIYLNWILPLHFVSLLVPLSAFTAINAVMLVILAFIGGYVSGWVFGWLWNWIGKKK